MLAANTGQGLPPSNTRLEQGRGDVEAMDTSRDNSMSPRSDGQKSSAREQEAMSIRSPSDDHEAESHNSYKRKSSYPTAMDTDSPSSYPKHVIVSSPLDSADKNRQVQNESLGRRPFGPDRYGRPSDNVVTPILTHEQPPSLPPFYHDSRMRYHAPLPPIYYHSDPHGYHMPPPGHYGPGPMPMDIARSYGMTHNVQLRPKRWACDYCNVATFLTYEEACAHEEVCATHHAMLSHGSQGFSTTSPPITHNSGLGALFHAASREVPQSWGESPGSISTPSVTPRFQKFRITGHEGRDGLDPSQKRMLLAMPSDNESLSDRQCYVRTDFVEVFEASEKDVASRHSKGAQKLTVGQVGIRCIHCSHLRTRDRAERAVCYPSSISRIYQTVADMQRFHFEQCGEIPEETRKIYKSLKTTRPRGMGSPQGYWIKSAKLMNLVDSESGIRFSSEGNSN